MCHSLDTDSFILLALQCFIACRGLVKDNGMNFIGVMGNLYRKPFFNLVGASYYGGVWERLIKSTCMVLGAPS